MVEVCAGSAILSAEAQKAGFQIFPLDHSHNRFKPFAAIFQVDLSSSHSLELLVQFFKEVQPIWCHFGLPAREKALSAELRDQGAPEPRPLRAAHALMGLDGLTVAEKRRVDAANLVSKRGCLALYIISDASNCFLGESREVVVVGVAGIFDQTTRRQKIF